MGLKLASVHMILPALVAAKSIGGAQILLLGKQDLYFTYEQLALFLRKIDVEFTEINERDRKFTDSFAFVAHEDWWRFRNFMHQETLFRMFGFSPESVHTLDQDAYEGAEIIHDMNLPIPKQLKESYDLVIDTGTIEHVFDLKQAFWNLHDLVKTGGSVLHVSPSNLLDHGFVNLNAVLLEDFYLQSGWIKQDLFYNASPKQDIGDNVLFVQIDPGIYDRPPDGYYLGLCGRFRKEANSAPVVPKQGLYLGLHDSWTRQSRKQSQHEPPPKKLGDGVRSLAKDWVGRLMLLRVLWAARRVKGRIVAVRQPFSG
jgi:SAM-dependent methyltransferase